VGRRYDSKTGDFDHHQSGGAGVRPNGVPYASFGLVWREYGGQAAGSDEAAEYVDRHFVQLVDADDVAVDVFSSALAGVKPYDLSRVIGRFNPSREEDPTPERMDALFMQAVDLAASILKREIANARERITAHSVVRAAVERARGSRIVVLDHFTYWHDTVITEAPEVWYVLYPVWPAVRKQWSVQAVPKRLDSFEHRHSLPEEWAGKEGAALAATTGVNDAVFCHSARFLAIAESKGEALRLAERAVQVADGA
jgi:uncharacterized UPF0160 family protein